MSMFGRGGLWEVTTPAVKNLVIVNAIVLLGTWLIGENFMIQRFALFAYGSPFFRPYQLVTHMFMHGGFWHLFFNMYTLIIFGVLLERMWGSKKFLLFYFVCGLGAALCHELVLGLQVHGFAEAGNAAAAARLFNTPCVGASGAIYGVLLGYAMLYPNSILQLLFPPVTLSAKWLVIIFAVIEIVTGLFLTRDGIAHFAHLGGMLFGLILILIWKKQNKLYSER